MCPRDCTPESRGHPGCGEPPWLTRFTAGGPSRSQAAPPGADPGLLPLDAGPLRRAHRTLCRDHPYRVRRAEPWVLGVSSADPRARGCSRGPRHGPHRQPRGGDAAVSALPGVRPARTFVAWAGRGCCAFLLLLRNSTSSTRSLPRGAAAAPAGGTAGVTCSSPLSSAKKLRAPLRWPPAGAPGGGAGPAAAAAAVSAPPFLPSFFLVLFGPAASSVSPMCSNAEKENEHFGFSHRVTAKSRERASTRAAVTSTLGHTRKDDSLPCRQGCVCTSTESERTHGVSDSC